MTARTPAILAVVGRLLLAGTLYWTAASARGERRPALKPSRARALWEQCLAARKAGDPGESLRLVRTLLRSYPENPIYLSFEAEALDRLHDFKDEAAAWELFMDVAPFPTDACPGVGRAYEKAGRAEKALAAHRRCYELDPSKSDLMLFYGEALDHADREAEAEKLLRGALARFPGYGDAMVGLARLLTKRGRLVEAQSLLDAALKGSPDNADALLAAAQLDEKMGQPARGRQRLLRAIRRSPTYADLYRVLGRLCERLADREGARQAYAALRKLEGGHAR